MNKFHSLAAMLLLTLGLQGSAFAAQYTATVHTNAGGDGPADLVSNGIPLKPGELSDPQRLRVLDGATEVALSATVLARWPQDNSIRSLLVQFSAPFAGAAKAFVVETGTLRTTSDRPYVAVSWSLPRKVLTLPADYLSRSLIVWEQKPLGQTGFAGWDQKQIDNYDSTLGTVGTAACARTDNYYDGASVTYQIYARTGQLKYLLNGRRWALHHRDDQIHQSGPSIGHGNCSGGYVNNTRYTFVEALVTDYLFWGDNESKRVAGLVVDNFYTSAGFTWWWYKAPNTRGFWTEREPAFAFLGIVSYYEATNNDQYRQKAQQLLSELHRMQVENGRRAWVHNLHDHDPEEGCPETAYGSSPWMSGLLLEGIIKYHKLTGDSKARESIIMALDDLAARYLATGDYAGRSFIYLGCTSVYSDGVPDLDNLISHAYAYGYLLTNHTHAPYRSLALALFEVATDEGYVGAAKQFDQAFRSSGHVPAYLDKDWTGSDTLAPNKPTNLRRRGS